MSLLELATKWQLGPKDGETVVGVGVGGVVRLKRGS